MDLSKDIRDFLMSRRARIGPEQVGMAPGHRRRVPGLRREEVAQLAGISTEYYTQIERGNVVGVSDDVLHAVCSTLRLTDDETTHFFDLARSAAGARPAVPPTPASGWNLPDGVQLLLDSMSTPAVVMTGNLDFIATNRLGRALYSPMFERSTGVPNLARFVFFDAYSSALFPQWARTADEAVGLLQSEAARSPHSPAITGIVGELATRSEEFRARWAAHNVTAHRSGAKQFCHPSVGELTLTYHVLDITAVPGMSLVGYTAEPNSPSAQAIQELSS